MVFISSSVIESATALLISTMMRRLLTYRPSASAISLMHLSYSTVGAGWAMAVAVEMGTGMGLGMGMGMEVGLERGWG